MGWDSASRKTPLEAGHRCCRTRAFQDDDRPWIPGCQGYGASLQLDTLPEGLREKAWPLPGGFQARRGLFTSGVNCSLVEVVDPHVAGQNGIHPAMEIDLPLAELQGDRGMGPEMI